MCNLSELTRSEAYTRTIRSVRISGYVTSVGLEDEFWTMLDELAEEEKMTRGQLLTTLYGEYQNLEGVKNFTSFLRVLCVAAMRLQTDAGNDTSTQVSLHHHDTGTQLPGLV